MTGQQLKNSILQEAISGRLVPQDPAEEPASVLLDKIRKEKLRLVKEGKLKKKDLEETPISEDEKPFDIPESWEWCRIRDIFIHASGKQQSSNNKQIGTLQKYITTSNLYWGFFVLDTLKEMYFSDEELVTCSAQKGDLLVCEGGAGYGRSAIWDKDYDICLQNHVHRLRPIIKGTCEYVYYLIYLLKESNRLASVGTAMPGLSANRLKELLIPLPPLAEQKRIVAKIEELLPKVEAYGKAQEALDKLNAELPERLKKSVLQEAITGRLVPQDPNDEPASVLLEHIREEKLRLVKEGKLKKKDLEETPISEDEIPFDIPDSWEWCKVSTILNILDSMRKPVTKGDREAGIYPYCGANGILDYVNDYIFDGKFVLIGEDGSVVTKYGNPVVNKIEGKIWVNNHAHIIQEYGALGYQDYIYYALKNTDISIYIHGFMPKFSQGDLRRTAIPLPPLAEQKRIVAKIEELFAKIDNLTK